MMVWIRVVVLEIEVEGLEVFLKIREELMKNWM